MLASFNENVKKPTEEDRRVPRAFQLTSIQSGAEALRADSCENIRE